MSIREQVAAALGVSSKIHDDDFLYRWHVDGQRGDVDKASTTYFSLGNYSANLLKSDVIPEARRILERRGIEWKPRTMLDFASGYGCVARHLPKVFPDWRISVCDIHPQAIEFCTKEFEVNGFVSRTDPTDFNSGLTFDFVFALSFFSHIPQHNVLPWLQWLRAQLDANGVLAFTANGDHMPKIAGVTMNLDEEGCAFIPQSEQKDLDGNDYGLALSHYRFMLRQLEAAGLELLVFRQALWWNIQDLYVCVAR